MKPILLLSITVAAATLLSSCATVLTGTTQRVTIDSTPPGAEIIIDGRMMGTTPANIRLDRDVNSFIDDGKNIYLEKPGYYSEGYYLGTDIEPTFILNVFVPVGFALDVVTGALMKYDSDYYNFKLIPMENTPLDQPMAKAEKESSEDDYEKLMKLVELYEEGMLSEEEFEAEKSKIFENGRK